MINNSLVPKNELGSPELVCLVSMPYPLSVNQILRGKHLMGKGAHSEEVYPSINVSQFERQRMGYISYE